jgi:hypothetical protein
MKLSVLCWSWGGKFGPEYVNRLRAGLSKHLHLDHELVCATDDPKGLDGDIRTLPITEFLGTPRCRRRMAQFSREFASQVGKRILSIDLDVVLVDDITPIVNRPEPLVCWKVAHAQVYSGSFVLMTAGVLDGLYQRFKADPEGYPVKVQPRGVPSDQAMLNHYLIARIPYWTEDDGFVTYFGDGYEAYEAGGLGPRHRKLPPEARIVVLGSADKAVMDEGRYEWVRRHWSSLASRVAA